MPGHDGFWLIERVRTKWPRTAITMAAGVMALDVVQKAQQLGAIDYVTKPLPERRTCVTRRTLFLLPRAVLSSRYGRMPNT
jgi:CheY-like chemotaxis protein